MSGSLDGASVIPLLQRVDFLAGVDERALKTLSEVGRRVTFQDGEYVVRQGEYGDAFYVIIRGRVGVLTSSKDGRMHEVTELGASQYFGEQAVNGKGERTASVRSKGSVVLLELRQAGFTKATKKFKEVKRRLEAAYTRRALASFVAKCRFFAELPSKTHEELLQSSSLQSYSKGAIVIKEGEPADRFHIIRMGIVRISRHTETDADEVLAYLGPEDFFGDQELEGGEPAYAVSAVAVEPVEVMSISRATFWRLIQGHPGLFDKFRRYHLERGLGESILSGGSTSMAFVKDVLEAGLGQARSALIINMDSCIRCGNCVQACDDLHGFSRLARRGQKLTRRKEMEKEGAHESLYFPSSCLQCETPECMVGCPTGAISRDRGGEVFIRDDCIGCGNCARNCEYGNISMADATEEEQISIIDLALGRKLTQRAKKGQPDPHADKEVRPELKAVKCDVCFERNFAACVYNCPTQAILRIDPRNYFEELQKMAPKASLDKGAMKTTTKRPSRWIDGVLQALSIAVSLIGGYALYLELNPQPWSLVQWASGYGAAGILLFLMMLGVRKRMRTRSLGSLALWARVHSVMGGVFIGSVLFHAGYGAQSILNGTLLGLACFVAFVGLSGQLINAVIPRLLTRSSDEAVLPEDAGPLREKLTTANEELLASFEKEPRKRVAQQVRRISSSAWTCFFKGHSPKTFVNILDKKAKVIPLPDEREHATALRIAENFMRIKMIRIHQIFEVALLAWVPMHLIAACLMVIFVVAHVATVFMW